MLNSTTKLAQLKKRNDYKNYRSARERLKKRNNFTVSSYTGSPDSVDVANLLEQFNYCPEQREEILNKYQNIVEFNYV